MMQACPATGQRNHHTWSITVKQIALILLACLVGGCASTDRTATTHEAGANAMNLGNFSVSLAVKDIAASRAFYEKLGFEMVSGDQSKNWIVLQNDVTKIGLFQGMFERN